MRNACSVDAGYAGSVSKRAEPFSEAELRRQNWLTLGIVLVAGLVTAGGALWCSTDGARERVGVSGLVVRHGGSGGSESVNVARERNLAGALFSISQQASSERSVSEANIQTSAGD